MRGKREPSVQFIALLVWIGYAHPTPHLAFKQNFVYAHIHAYLGYMRSVSMRVVHIHDFRHLCVMSRVNALPTVDTRKEHKGTTLLKNTEIIVSGK